MYQEIKKALKKLIPGSAIYKAEPFLRYWHYLYLKGNKYECNICGSGLKTFIPQGNHLICPRCGSIGRTRRLWNILNNYLYGNKKILDFSPSRSLYRKMKDMSLDYTGSDLSGDFLSDVSYDICNIDSNKETYDLIICYHILEHIPDDKMAMQELFRVLKSGGLCIIQTPFKDGDIYEDESIKHPAERKKHFGQEDHVRIYSVSGLRDRLRNSGFEVDVREYSESDGNKFCFDPEHIVLICRK